MVEISQGDDYDVQWEHLDYYVRRHGSDLYLVETLLKQVYGARDEVEICTFYYTLDQLDPDWADALEEQGADLEAFKSRDFVPPDEIFIMRGTGTQNAPD